MGGCTMKKILISGGTGLVGNKIIENFSDAEFYILTRSDRDNTDNVTYINWSEDDYLKEVPEVDVVINLAGASISQFWTEENKEKIVHSRVDSTRELKRIIDHQETKPFLISASAVGYYPTSKANRYTEYDKYEPFDFLSKTVHVWENEAKKIEDTGVKTAYTRFGIIFSKEGGALPLIALPYKLFVGGNIGDGHQPYAFVHIEDLVRALEFIADKELTGVFNITASYPATQEIVGKSIAKTIKRPYLLPAPKLLFEMTLGEQSKLITEGQRALPRRLIEEGFKFKFETVEEAISDLYGK